MSEQNFNCVRKLAFESRNDAKKHAGSRGKGLRPYHCAHCGLWHNSTKSRRAVKLTKKRYT